MSQTKIGDIADRVIGYYAGRHEDDRFWWRGEEMLELMLWSSPLEAHRYLVRQGVPQSYHNFYPVEFGEIILAGEYNFTYRMSRATLIRFFDTMREDLPELPPTHEIDLGTQEYIQYPPFEEIKSRK